MRSPFRFANVSRSTVLQIQSRFVEALLRYLSLSLSLSLPFSFPFLFSSAQERKKGFISKRPKNKLQPKTKRNDVSSRKSSSRSMSWVFFWNSYQLKEDIPFRVPRKGGEVFRKQVWHLFHGFLGFLTNSFFEVKFYPAISFEGFWYQTDVRYHHRSEFFLVLY